MNSTLENLSLLLREPAPVTILGVIVGSIIAFLSSLFIIWHKDRKEKKSIRKMMHIEIEYNIQKLTTYWEKIGYYKDEESDNPFKDGFDGVEISWNKNFASIKMPTWNMLAYKNLFYKFGFVFNENDASKIMYIYDMLEKISSIHKEHVEAYKIYDEEENNIYYREKRQEIGKNLLKLVKECAGYVDQIIKDGNPI